MAEEKIICDTCPRHCSLSEGEVGNCNARGCKDGKIVSLNYGRAVSLALDPIEKKPLRLFCPGSTVLSVGSWGCNMHCPFCQNHSISQIAESPRTTESPEPMETDSISPQELAVRALGLRSKGNIGAAFTYNEPLVGWEYVRDAEKEIKYFNMKNVIVTNGCVLPNVLDEVLPYTDAMNIDLKSFTQEGYKKLGGDLDTVKHAIAECAKHCHVELTTLIVPGFNDSEDEMKQAAQWVASIDDHIALHVTRFFPRYKMKAVPPTDVTVVYELAGVAQQYLKNVFTGNC